MNRIIDSLHRAGAEVLHGGSSPVHVSGHASQEELKFLLNIVQPEWFVPVHGEYPHMVHHARLAEAVGVATDHVLVCEDGDVLVIEQRDDGTPLDVERRAVPAGYLYVDGIVGDVGQGVLRDRRNLAEEGVVVVIVTVDATTGEVVTGPEIVTRGWVYAPEAEELLEEAKAAVLASLEEAADEGATDFETLRRHCPPLARQASSASAPGAGRRSSRWSWRSRAAPSRARRAGRVPARDADVGGGAGVSLRGCPRPRRGVVARRPARRPRTAGSRSSRRATAAREVAAAEPVDVAGRGRRPAGSSPGTGPTCSPWACSWSGLFALGLWTDLAGPVGAGSPTVPAPLRPGPGGGPGGVLRLRRAAALAAAGAGRRSRRRDRRGRATRRPSGPPSASRSARSSCSSPTSASSTSPPAARRSSGAHRRAARRRWRARRHDRDAADRRHRRGRRGRDPRRRRAGRAAARARHLDRR